VRNDVAAENAKGFLKMLEMLDDCDDVQAVHHNGDIAEEVLRDIRL
jgi:transcriptional/translational regulatory protein YebC/TACO1